MDIFPINPDKYHVCQEYGFMIKEPLKHCEVIRIVWPYITLTPNNINFSLIYHIVFSVHADLEVFFVFGLNNIEFLPAYFSAWNVLAKQMPELVGKKELRAAVNKMPLLDVDRLCGYREHRLAHVQLSLIGAAYIWQEGDIGVAKELPKCLSVPWVAVSRWLGIQPILSHSSLVLANCRYDTQSGLIESLYNLPGGSEAAWFVTVTAQVELAFATGIKMTGGSAAQSSTLQCIDAVLGVQHEPEIGEFLQNMRRYMPTLHRQFIETIEEHSKVKSLVESSENEALTSAYNQALQAVIDFRSYHVQIVTKYIVVMANRKSRNKEYEALATRGTGGSSILPFLKSLRTTTSNTKIPEAQTE
ncbi:MYG-like protein [Mya arenaria]|uniref:MYG-like protein n=1 Tax=Mya arenaria TaxID=6604 RepID=A0ABY7DM35_MYAAR|nr:MYG-like protein [Mya arenaria]